MGKNENIDFVSGVSRFEAKIDFSSRRYTKVSNFESLRVIRFVSRLFCAAC